MSIFISYAHEDIEAALSIYEMLDEKGYSAWIDKKNLLPGQDWALEIDKAIRNSDIFVACLSTNSVSQRGYFLAELKKASKVLETVPEEEVFLIPVRLDDCQVPSRIKRLHWLDYFAKDGPERLVEAISLHLGPSFAPELVFVPAGEFLMGSNSEIDKDAGSDEIPQHRVYIPKYYIGKYTITNLQYQAFVNANEHQVLKDLYMGNIDDHPAVHVSWNDAIAYCDWLAGITGKPYRLPTEAEWEKAARGTDGRIYPWGNEWDKTKCNSYESHNDNSTPVGLYSPKGDSPYGCADMAGNVSEWCRSIYKSYHYTEDDGSEKFALPGTRVLRGGAFYDIPQGVRCASRSWDDLPSYGSFDVGFRVVVSASDSDI